MTEPRHEARNPHFYLKLPLLLILQLAGLASPWLRPSSVGCWNIKSSERYPLCISAWGAFLPHDTVINSSGLLRHPDCCSLPALLSFHWIIRCYNLDPDQCVFWIFFLVSTEICFFFNIAKSPSRTHHFQWKFFSFLEPHLLSVTAEKNCPPTSNHDHHYHHHQSLLKHTFTHNYAQLCGPRSPRKKRWQSKKDY